MAKSSKSPPSRSSRSESGRAKSRDKKLGSATAGVPTKAGAKHVQLSLDAAVTVPATPQVPVLEGPLYKAAPDKNPVVELVMSAKGTWKHLASGKKVQIDDSEWQLELGRMLAKKAPADDPSGAN